MSRTRVKLRDRFLAALLSVLMIVAMIPVTTLQAFAATTEYPDAYTVTVTDGENSIEGAQVSLVASEIMLELNATTDSNGVAAFAESEIYELFQYHDGSTVSATVYDEEGGWVMPKERP